MNLYHKFRLYYDEVKSKHTDSHFNLFRAGYIQAWRDASEMYQKGVFTTEALAQKLEELEEGSDEKSR